MAPSTAGLWLVGWFLTLFHDSFFNVFFLFLEKPWYCRKSWPFLPLVGLICVDSVRGDPTSSTMFLDPRRHRRRPTSPPMGSCFNTTLYIGYSKSNLPEDLQSWRKVYFVYQKKWSIIASHIFSWKISQGKQTWIYWRTWFPVDVPLNPAIDSHCARHPSPCDSRLVFLGW